MAKTQLTLAKRVEELEKQLTELRKFVEATQPAPAKTMAAAATGAGTASTFTVTKPVAGPKPAKIEEESGVSAEILVVIAAAVAHVMGSSARIRSARPMMPGSESSPWAQQGRVFIQASHNLALSR